MFFGQDAFEEASSEQATPTSTRSMSSPGFVRQIVPCNDASLRFDCDKQGLQRVPVNLNCLLVHSVLPESNFPIFRRSHPDTVEMTARYDGAVGPLFIITVASVSSSSDSKTLLLLPWLPLPPWLPKVLKNICEQTITANHIHSCLHAAACCKSRAECVPHTRRCARKCDIRCARVATGASTSGSSHCTSGSLM